MSSAQPSPAAPDLLPVWLRRSVLLALVLVTGLPALRILGAQPIFGDDHSSHLAAIAELVSLLRAGETDLFCPTFNLGFPMLLYYQPLPHLAVALLHLASFGQLGLELCFNLSVVTLWCAYPLAVHAGARRLGLDDHAALLAALAAPTVRSALPFGFTLDSVMGLGLYTQLWAMVFFPLALGWGARALVAERLERSFLGAAGLLTLVWLCHAFYGVAASTAIAGLAILRGRLRQSLPRLLLLGALVLASLLFWLIPLALTADFAGGWPWDGVDRWEGYGARRVLATLFTGRLLDDGGVPLLSLALGGGLAVAITRVRRDPALRALLCCFLVFLLFLIGRRSLGHLVDLQPANLGLQLFRYLGPLHLTAVLLAGVGLAAAVRWLGARLGHPILCLGLALVLFLPVLVHLGLRERAYFRTIASYAVSESELRAAGAAIDAAVRSGTPPGRIYAHAKSGHGAHLVAALLARYTGQPLGQSYGVGMHDSLGFYYLEQLDPADPFSLALYNFRFLVSRPGSPLARVAGPRLLRRGLLEVDRVEGEHGWFALAELSGELRGRPREVRPAVLRWLAEAEARRGGFLQILPAGVAALPSTSGNPSGRIEGEGHSTTAHRARVRLHRPGLLVLKLGFHPFWSLSVDGRPARALHLTPCFLGAALPAGVHEVRFRFENPGYQKALALGSVGLWLLLGVVLLLRSLRARRRSGPRAIPS
jgi:hypothetical protein